MSISGNTVNPLESRSTLEGRCIRVAPPSTTLVVDETAKTVLINPPDDAIAHYEARNDGASTPSLWVRGTPPQGDTTIVLQHYPAPIGSVVIAIVDGNKETVGSITNIGPDVAMEFPSGTVTIAAEELVLGGHSEAMRVADQQIGFFRPPIGQQSLTNMITLVDVPSGTDTVNRTQLNANLQAIRDRILEIQDLLRCDSAGVEYCEDYRCGHCEHS